MDEDGLEKLSTCRIHVKNLYFIKSASFEVLTAMLRKIGLLRYQRVTALEKVIVPSSSSEFNIPSGQVSLETGGSKSEKDN